MQIFSNCLEYNWSLAKCHSTFDIRFDICRFSLTLVEIRLFSCMTKSMESLRSAVMFPFSADTGRTVRNASRGAWKYEWVVWPCMQFDITGSRLSRDSHICSRTVLSCGHVIVRWNFNDRFCTFSSTSLCPYCIGPFKASFLLHLFLVFFSLYVMRWKSIITKYGYFYNRG